MKRGTDLECKYAARYLNNGIEICEVCAALEKILKKSQKHCPLLIGNFLLVIRITTERVLFDQTLQRKKREGKVFLKCICFTVFA